MPIYEIFLIAACLYAALMDFLFYRIPNWIVLAVIGVYLVKAIVALVSGIPIATFIIPFASFGGVLVVGFILFAIRIFGAGDVKLLAACSLWMGEINIFQFIVLTTLSGGALALFYLFFHQGVDFLRDLIFNKIINKFGGSQIAPIEKKAVPYGIAICIGVIWVLRVNGVGT